MIFFRVFKDSDDPVGTLYNRLFQPVTKIQTSPSDLVVTSTAEQFAAITAAEPKNIILRVHEDKSNKDAGQGTYYNENFEEVGANGSPFKVPPGGTVILTITPDEFEAMVATRA